MIKYKKSVKEKKMKKIIENEIKEQIGYEEAMIKLRNIWHELSEGFETMPQTHPEIGLFYRNIQKGMPHGWKVKVMLYSDVEMQYQDPKTKKIYVIYKNRFGKEMENAF